MKRRQKWVSWLVIGVVTIVLLVASLATQPSPSNKPTARFDDATPTGGKGFALLMNRLGFQSRVQHEPLQKVPADARAWLILDPNTAFSKREARDLLKWVDGGGTLIWCVATNEMFDWSQDNSSQGTTFLQTELGVSDLSIWTPTPAQKGGDGPFPTLDPFRFGPVSLERSGVSKAQASSTKLEVSKPHLPLAQAPGGTIARIDRGKGRIYLFADAWMFTNYGLSKPDNAILASNLVRAPNFERGLADSGAVYFDERQHDEDGAPPEPDSLMARLRKPPFSYALWQLLAAGLLAWAFAARRLGSAVALPERGPVTRASQFALAMGGLFQKIGRPRAASEVIGENFRRRLASRVGLSPNEPDAVLARRAHEIAGLPFELVDRLLLQTRTPATSEAAALRDAQEMEHVLERLEGR